MKMIRFRNKNNRYVFINDEIKQLKKRIENLERELYKPRW